jgi:hypothetical protein
MRCFIAACAAAILIAIGSAVGLNFYQERLAGTFMTSSVRI